MYSGDGYDQYGWAAFMAGGSMAAIPAMEQEFLNQASTMKPLSSTANQYVLGSEGKGYIIYSEAGKVYINLRAGNYKARWINPRDGKVVKEDSDIRGGESVELAAPENGSILWLSVK